MVSKTLRKSRNRKKFSSTSQSLDNTAQAAQPNLAEPKDEAFIVPEEIQDTLEKRAYVHHDKGREHGHDWDDWLKTEKILKAGKKKLKNL
jgi:hypothetical protein